MGTIIAAENPHDAEDCEVIAKLMASIGETALSCSIHKVQRLFTTVLSQIPNGQRWWAFWSVGTISRDSLCARHSKKNMTRSWRQQKNI